MHSYYTFLALGLANERAHEADRRHLADLAKAARPARPSLGRRGLTWGVRLVVRVVAAIAAKFVSYRSDEAAQPHASTE
jgi:hypothetical protein